jgi:hypothetical protein
MQKKRQTPSLSLHSDKNLLLAVALAPKSSFFVWTALTVLSSLSDFDFFVAAVKRSTGGMFDWILFDNSKRS